MLNSNYAISLNSRSWIMVPLCIHYMPTGWDWQTFCTSWTIFSSHLLNFWPSTIYENLNRMENLQRKLHPNLTENMPQMLTGMFDKFSRNYQHACQPLNMVESLRSHYKNWALCGHIYFGNPFVKSWKANLDDSKKKINILLISPKSWRYTLHRN